MLLHLVSPDRLLEARERLTALGVEHSLLPDRHTFDVRAETSIIPPGELAAKLADLGPVECVRSRTPLLDVLGKGHEVVVEVPGRPAIRFKNFSSHPVWIAGPCSLDELNDVR